MVPGLIQCEVTQPRQVWKEAAVSDRARVMNRLGPLF